MTEPKKTYLRAAKEGDARDAERRLQQERAPKERELTPREQLSAEFARTQGVQTRDQESRGLRDNCWAPPPADGAEYVPIIVNAGYGGGSFTPLFARERRKIIAEQNLTPGEVKHAHLGSCCREFSEAEILSFQIEGEVIRRLGKRASTREFGSGAREVRYVRRDLLSCVYVHDYDGYETIMYEWGTWRANRVRAILTGSGSAESRIARSLVALDEPPPRVSIDTEKW